MSGVFGHLIGKWYLGGQVGTHYGTVYGFTKVGEHHMFLTLATGDVSAEETSDLARSFIVMDFREAIKYGRFFGDVDLWRASVKERKEDREEELRRMQEYRERLGH